MHLSQHKLWIGNMELALGVKFHLDFHWITRPWRRTLTNGGDAGYVFSVQEMMCRANERVVSPWKSSQPFPAQVTSWVPRRSFWSLQCWWCRPGWYACRLHGGWSVEPRWSCPRRLVHTARCSRRSSVPCHTGDSGSCSSSCNPQTPAGRTWGGL